MTDINIILPPRSRSSAATHRRGPVRLAKGRKGRPRRLRKSGGLRFYDLGITKNESGIQIEEPFVMDIGVSGQAMFDTADAAMTVKTLDQLRLSPVLDRSFIDKWIVLTIERFADEGNSFFTLQENGKWEDPDGAELTNELISTSRVTSVVSNMRYGVEWPVPYHGFSIPAVLGGIDYTEITGSSRAYYFTASPSRNATPIDFEVKMSAEVFLVPQIQGFRVQLDGGAEPDINSYSRFKRAYRNLPDLENQPTIGMWGVFEAGFLTKEQFVEFVTFYLGRAGIYDGPSVATLNSIILSEDKHEYGRNQGPNLSVMGDTVLLAIIHQDGATYYQWYKAIS